MERKLKELLLNLYDIGIVKFGDYVTKSGANSPIYFDLRIMIAYPELMSKFATILWQVAETKTDETQVVGVPYTALPLATLISSANNVPMLIKRKEAKTYGTKKIIEGNYKSGDKCIIIEDVITSGSSVLETVDALQEEGLIVTEVLVIIDRQQGGRKNIRSRGIKIRSLYDITLIMNYLEDLEKVSRAESQGIKDYIQNCQLTNTRSPEKLREDKLKSAFILRLRRTRNLMAFNLFNLMEEKKTILCLAADLTKANDILYLAELAGEHIVILKLHADIIEDFSSDFIKRLKYFAEKYKFYIMEDRKFADIGNTVVLQYTNGIHKIAEWADIITVHPIAGPTVIEAFDKAFKKIDEPRGMFLIAEMSTRNAFTDADYREKVLMVSLESDKVIGFVSQSNITTDLGMIQLTPGVKLNIQSDNLGQQYNTPEEVVNMGTDIAVVGRGITEATDRLAAILEYKKQLWEAYIKRLAYHPSMRQI